MPSLAEIKAAFRFDETAQRWRSPSGRFVSQSALKRELVRFADATAGEIRDLARQLNAGEINLPEWQLGTAFRIKNLHLAMHAAARGGFHNFTASDYGRLGARLKQQYQHLQGFAIDIENGRLSPAQIEARAALYGAAGNAAYEAGRYDGWRDRTETGVFVEMRNLLAPAEHCEAGNGRPGCADETARGWVPLGALSLPGGRRCLSNCKCSVEYREVEL